MSHYTPGTAGEFRGKMGQTVISKWRKILIGRTRPVKTGKKPTFKQLQQRLKMRITTQCLTWFSLAIKLGYPANKSKSYGWEKAVQYHIKNAIVGTYPDYEIDYAKIQLSQGRLDQVNTPEMFTENDVIYVDWLNPENLKLGVEETDLVFCCVEGLKKGRRLVEPLQVATRTDGEFRLDIKPWYFFGPKRVWIFLTSEDGKKVSTTKYLGSFE